MSSSKTRSRQRPSLEERAEAVLDAPPDVISSVRPEDIQALIEELRARQADLDLQNEELRRVQAEAEESQLRYSHLFHFAPVGYVILDHKGIVREANLTAAEVLGLERRYLERSSFARFVPSESLDAFHAHCALTLESLAPQTCHLKLRRKDGACFDAQLTSIPIRGAADHPRHLGISIADVSEQKRAEEAREEAILQRDRYLAGLNRALRGLLPSLPEISYDAFVQTLGPPSGASRVNVFLSRRGPEGEPRLSREAEWCAAGIELRTHNPDLPDPGYRNVCPEWKALLSRGKAIMGRVRDFPEHERAVLEPEGIKSLLYLPLIVDGDLAGFVGLDDCIEERLWAPGDLQFLQAAAQSLAQAMSRELAEDRRREVEAWLRQLVDNTDVVLWMRSLDEPGSVYVNPAFERVWGRSRQSMTGDPDSFLETIHPEDRDRMREVMRRQQQGESFGAIEYRVLRPDGEVRWVRENSVPIRDPHGRIYREARIATDISDRKDAEHKLLQYGQDLERLVEERAARIRELERQRAESEKVVATGRMAARIAHEINNPLGGIKNALLLIKDAVPTDHQYYDYMGLVEQEIDRIARIVHQMFGLYRPGQEQRDEFSVEMVVDDIVTLLEPARRARDVRIEIDRGSAPLDAAMPEDLFRQIVHNLVQNAIEASPPGGVIHIGAAVDQGELAVTVSDQGPGIPEEERSQIYYPFYTTKDSHTTGGLGLGLAICKTSVTALGGTIDFESVQGQGTVFRVMLPLGAGGKETHDG
jgi:two-component system sporulation sensor kinase C